MNATKINLQSQLMIATRGAYRYLHQQVWWGRFHIEAALLGWRIRHQ